MFDDIKCAFRADHTDMWHTISRMCGTCAINEPCDDDFFTWNVSILPKKKIILLMILIYSKTTS